jgi:hypothetical protein
MDDEINVSQEDIQRLSMAEKQQLQMFIQTESQKSNIQKSTSALPSGRGLLLTECGFSCPRIDGNVLQKMHYRLNIFGQIGQQRRGMHVQLCQ